MTLFSTASQHIYPDNNYYNFIVELAQVIYLGSNDRWEIGLCEYACPPPKIGTHQAFDIVGESRALIYCNLIVPQFIGDQLDRCLRTISIPSQYCNYNFHNIYYVPVEKRLNVMFIYRLKRPMAKQQPSPTVDHPPL